MCSAWHVYMKNVFYITLVKKTSVLYCIDCALVVYFKYFFHVFLNTVLADNTY